MATTKMTFKVHSGMWKAFLHQVDSLPIHLSKFLDGVIDTEIRHLAHDMEGKVLSRMANRYIANRLLNEKSLETTPISIVVEKETADALNQVVKTTQMVRDAFFNRVVMFLRSSDNLLRYLELPRDQIGVFRGVSTGAYAASPMKALMQAFADPLELIRFGVQAQWGTGLYLIELPKQLHGFACYMDDAQVPGTEEFRAAETLIDDFEQFEALTLVRPKRKRR